MATNGICNSFKVESLEAGHCFNATQSAVSCSANSTASVTGLTSTAGLSTGMSVTGTNVAANTYIAAITGATTLALSIATTGTNSALTFTADVFKALLIKNTPSLTYGPTQTNVGTPGSGSPSTANIGTDETSGTGYTSGGVTLTNVQPALSSTTATTSFATNPSWTGATFGASAMVVYNSSTRVGAAAAPLNGRTVGVYDFSGSQTVTSGTFTVLLPTNAAGTALIQLA